MIPQVPEAVFTFFSLLSLSFRLGHYGCSVFQFTDSFLSLSILLLSSLTELFQWLHFSVLKTPLGLFFISSPPLLKFYFFICFKCICNCWSHFYSALKSLPNNSNISITSVLVSATCLFSFSFRSSWFLVWQAIFIKTWIFWVLCYGTLGVI